MTPRSGSTALSAALASTRRLGRGGERLNHKNKDLNEIAATTRPRTRRELLERVIEASRTRNGVAQIKCDLPQVLPFLLDADCFRILRQAHVVYLTRRDLLGQAISRYRSSAVGVSHARTDRTATDAQAPYDFGAIHMDLDRLARMMAAYEKVFAMLDIRPLRITYEEIVAEPGRVVRDIARLVDIRISPAKIPSLEAGGYRKVSGRNNDDLRARFLAEAQARLGLE
jgi:LPS sulfotransferase NodH